MIYLVVGSPNLWSIRLRMSSTLS